MTKHVHYESIIEWAKDPDHPWQFKQEGSCGWLDINLGSEPSWRKDCEYRKKPREFKEGYWYPIVTKMNGKMIARYNGFVFVGAEALQAVYGIDDLVFIGEGFQPDFGDN